jgi:hypothetical protein
MLGPSLARGRAVGTHEGLGVVTATGCTRSLGLYLSHEVPLAKLRLTLD